MELTLLQAPINEPYDTIPRGIPLILASCMTSKAASSFPACPAASINALRNICMRDLILELAPSYCSMTYEMKPVHLNFELHLNNLLKLKVVLQEEALYKLV